MVALPNLTFTITPPGGTATNYTSKLAFDGGDQISIAQNFGRQGDTASFILMDEYATTPSFVIKALSQVRLVDNNLGLTLFAGVVTDPILIPLSPNLNQWTLTCVDYTFYADNAIVHGTYIGQTVDQIVVNLTQQAACGITAATVANGGYVAPGPTIADFVLNYATLSDAWRKLAILAAQVTPYGWYVDENRHLHFYDSSTALSAGVTFTTSPTAVGLGSTTQGHYDWGSQASYEWDGTSVRNRILVQGANQTITYNSVTTSPPTDTWRADGTDQAWGLRYTVTGSPVLHVNGVTTSVTVVNAGSSIPAGTKWFVTQNSVGGWYLGTSSAPASGTIIKIWYTYQVPVVARANDYASQSLYTGPNGGVYSEYINDTSLTTVPMALARAQRQRTEYAFAVERISFTTTPSWVGWIRSGQTCTITNRFVPDAQNNYTWGVTDTFIVISNSVQFITDGGYRTMQITAVRL